MSVTEDNKALVRRYAQELWNNKNLRVLDEYVDPEYTYYPPDGLEPIRGAEGLKKAASAILEAFPDHLLSIDEMIAEGDKVVWRWTMQGTHLGPGMGVPPTNSSVTVTGIAIYRLARGKIVERRGEADTLGLLTKIGAIADTTNKM